MREIALDTETTGLDPNKGDRIVEIGCVEMDSHIRTGRVFHCYLNPQRNMPAEAEKVHGLSDSFLKDKPLFRDKVDEFLEFLGDAKLVIHNAAFDMKFINYELSKLRRKTIAMNNTIDTLLIARKKFPGSPANLDALCRRFNIDTSARTKHGALLDAELLADVYLELNGGRQAAMLLGAGGSNKINYDEDQGVVFRPLDIEHRLFSASDEEQLMHKKFLDKIKDPIWNKIEVA